MKKFIVIYSATSEAMKKMNEMGHEVQRINMKLWVEWQKKHREIILDMGPIGNEYVLNSSGELNNKKEFTAYSIMQAENVESLSKLFKDHPHFVAEGCEIEIHEMRQMPQS